MKIFKKTMIKALIIAAVIGGAIWAIRDWTGKKGISINLSQAAVVKEMKELNRLETASFTIEKIVEAGQQGNAFQDLLYGDRILLIANGKVIAGIDMAKIQDKNISVRANTLNITLPAPEIFSSSLDSSKTRVYDRRQGILSRGNKDLESEARKAAESSIRTAACEAGILDEARKNAEERVKQLFQFAGFDQVVVSVPTGGC